MKISMLYYYEMPQKSQERYNTSSEYWLHLHRYTLPKF